MPSVVATSMAAIAAMVRVGGGVKILAWSGGVNLGDQTRRWRLVGAKKLPKRRWCRWKLTEKVSMSAVTAALDLLEGLGR